MNGRLIDRVVLYWDDTVILVNEFNTCMLVCGKQILFAF